VFLDRDGVLIFRAPAASLRARPAESVFVDDTLCEADGGRTLGCTAFHLDCTLVAPDFEHWRLARLGDLLVCLDATGSAT
jgi:FMN phosphatase YigB (HAD superfamily)